MTTDSRSFASSDVDTDVLAEAISDAERLLSDSLRGKHCEVLMDDRFTSLYVFPNIHVSSSLIYSVRNGDGFIFVRDDDRGRWRLRWYINYKSVGYGVAMGFTKCSVVRASSLDSDMSWGTFAIEDPTGITLAPMTTTDAAFGNVGYLISQNCSGMALEGLTTTEPTYRILLDFDQAPVESEPLASEIRELESNIRGYCIR